jgi:protein PsiE
MTDQKNPAKTLDQRMLSFADPIGRFLTDGFHILALFAIGGRHRLGRRHGVLRHVQKGAATIEDLLLLFIDLEIGSMVGIYFRTNHMPVRFLLYVGITELTRRLIDFVQHEEIADIGVLVLTGAILILAFEVFVIRFASNRFPAQTDGEVARTRYRGPSGRGWSARCRERLDSLASPQTLPPFSSACPRMADKVVVGVIASGSTLTCRIEGRPDANARSYAGRNSAVSSTVSPWPPKARA